MDLARAYASAVWAYRCIKLRADAVAGVPLILVERDGARIGQHGVLRLLRDVNPHTMNLGDLLRATEAAYNIWGVAYWLKVQGEGRELRGPARHGRDYQGVRWLQWLNPQTVEPEVDARRGVVAYKQTTGSETRIYPAEDVIAFRNFDPLDDLGGLSPLGVALHEVNAEMNAARFVAAFFANDARPAGLLTTEQPLPDHEAARALAWWQRLFRGTDNKWKTGIVGGGLKWTRITFPPEDLALAELRAEDRRAICAVFGVPAGLAGAWEAATYATAREQKASFYEDTILPQLEYIAEVLNWALLPHYPDLVLQGARLAFDTDSIAALRETASDRAQRLAALYGAGVITRNEARTGLGLPALPEDEDGFAHELHSAALPAEGVKAYDARDALRDELARWERFALKRIKAGRPLRTFTTAAIPDGLREAIGRGLARAVRPEDVLALFGEALAALERGDDPAAALAGRTTAAIDDSALAAD
jgi:HK97 family phage portal protein